MDLKSNVCTTVACHCSKLHVNRPRFNRPCKGGAGCPNANCYYEHPPEREQPKLIYKFCRFGAKCSRASCAFLHPERHEQDAYVERKVRKCKWRSNCPEKDGECKLDGHDEAPAMCRFGAACRNKDSKKKPCLWSHEQKQALCPKGEDCNRGAKCWFAFHDPAEVIALQEQLAKLNVKAKPADDDL